METKFRAFLKTVEDDQGNRCSTEMKVPIKFILQHIHSLNMKVLVKGWKNWSMSLWGSTLSSVTFSKGWSQFAAENRLQTGDHLVFRLVQHSCFQVRIYDKHGNDKTNNSHSCPESDYVSPNPFYVDKTASSLQANPGSASFCKTTSSAQTNPDSSSFCKTSSSSVQTNPGSSSICKTSSSLQSNPGSSSFLKTTSSVQANSSSSSTHSFSSIHKTPSPFPDRISSHKLIILPVPDTEQKHINIPNLFPDHISSHKLINMPNPENPDIEEKIYQCDYYKSTRPPVTAAQKLKAVHDAELYKPTGPYTTIKMKKSHIYRGFLLTIPRSFSKAWLSIDKTHLDLIDSSGKKWDAIWLGLGRNSLSGGWRQFALDHCIEEDDVCVFELVSGNKAVPCFLVNIFRVLELPPHLVNGGNDHELIRNGGIKRRHMHEATTQAYVINRSKRWKFLES